MPSLVCPTKKQGAIFSRSKIFQMFLKRALKRHKRVILLKLNGWKCSCLWTMELIQNNKREVLWKADIPMQRKQSSWLLLCGPSAVISFLPHFHTNTNVSSSVSIFLFWPCAKEVRYVQCCSESYAVPNSKEISFCLSQWPQKWPRLQILWGNRISMGN